MLNISQKEVESRLSFDNPWWNSEQATPFTNLSPRDYLPSFYNLLTDLSVKRAVILLGPRRVGNNGDGSPCHRTAVERRGRAESGDVPGARHASLHRLFAGTAHQIDGRDEQTGTRHHPLHLLRRNPVPARSGNAISSRWSIPNRHWFRRRRATAEEPGVGCGPVYRFHAAAAHFR